MPDSNSFIRPLEQPRSGDRIDFDVQRLRLDENYLRVSASEL